jgi:hypothetical protein
MSVLKTFTGQSGWYNMTDEYYFNFKILHLIANSPVAHFLDEPFYASPSYKPHFLHRCALCNYNWNNGEDGGSI